MSKETSTEGKVILYVLAAISVIVCFPWGLPVAFALTALANKHQDPD